MQTIRSRFGLIAASNMSACHPHHQALLASRANSVTMPFAGVSSLSLRARLPVMTMTGGRQSFAFSTHQAPTSKEIDEMTMTQRIQSAYELIKRVQRKDTIRYMCDNRVPIDLEGSMMLPVIPERKLITQYLDEKLIDREMLDNHLYELLMDFFEGLQAKDYDKLQGFTEGNLVERLRKNEKASDS